MAAEVWQFVALVAAFAVAAVLWLFVVYLPGRTLERWENQRPDDRRDERREAPGKHP